MNRLKALDVPGVKDRESVEERLLGLYSESGQDEKLKSFDDKLNQNDSGKRDNIY